MWELSSCLNRALTRSAGRAFDIYLCGLTLALLDPLHQADALFRVQLGQEL